jgi:hypothetical protein
MKILILIGLMLVSISCLRQKLRSHETTTEECCKEQGGFFCGTFFNDCCKKIGNNTDCSSKFGLYKTCPG